ncbi:MAG: hypothetical protein ACLFSI_00580 [Halorhodospira sp.]
MPVMARSLAALLFTVGVMLGGCAERVERSTEDAVERAEREAEAREQAERELEEARDEHRGRMYERR